MKLNKLSKALIGTFFSLGLFLLVGELAKPGFAQSITVEILDPYSWLFKVPISSNKVADTARVWARPSLGTFGNTTTCNLMYAGKGIIAGVTGFGAASDSVVFYDSAAASGLVITTVDTTKLIAMVTIDTAKVSGNYEFSSPLPFVNGIVACPKNNTGIGVVRYYKQQ